jgi:hypothetical protein
LFEVARRRAEWTVDQLWMHYLALGGTLVVFDLEAYLSGLVPLPAGQQDVLACALNERLRELYTAARVPYLTVQQDVPPQADAMNVLEAMRGAPSVEDTPER